MSGIKLESSCLPAVNTEQGGSHIDSWWDPHCGRRGLRLSAELPIFRGFSLCWYLESVCYGKLARPYLGEAGLRVERTTLYFHGFQSPPVYPGVRPASRVCICELEFHRVLRKRNKCVPIERTFGKD